ncbi:FecCD family ABC transporter permease [Carnobacterium gallinarum]|uniref:FecCD family ABC transporter permease n=1 Tax=Carnobacterium gallinarum TaxID=2749 RepID=UPI00054FB17B|nr:iron ABC transporter permease [Carnobacterium gallinarum]
MNQENTLLPIQKKYRTRSIWILSFGLCLLLFVMLLSISLGAANIDFQTVIKALTDFQKEETSQQIIRSIRIPRVIGAALVGGSLAVAGAMMQGMTKNPLADSGLLGLNAGASLMMAISFAFFPKLPYLYLILLAFLGAGLGALLVYGIGSLGRGGFTPLRLILAGTAVSALLASLSQAISLYKNTGQDLAFWYVGGTASATWENLKIMTPWLIVAFIGAIFLAKSITLLNLGEEVAISLGQNVTLIRFLGMGIVLILAGASVSVVGPIGFVGLLIPHMTRSLVGNDYRLVIPCSALLGGVLVVLADLGARLINPPFETPFGALISLIGIPFFLYLARNGGRSV